MNALLENQKQRIEDPQYNHDALNQPKDIRQQELFQDTSKQDLKRQSNLVFIFLQFNTNLIYEWSSEE